MADYPQVAARRAHAAAHAPQAHARDTDAFRRMHAAQQSRCALAYARRLATRMQQSRCALAYARRLATRMPPSRTARRGCFPKNARMRRLQSRCAPAYVGDADASEECMPRSRVLSCKLRFDAAEPRALDGPSLARRRAPSPLIPSPIYGIIYEFSDFWAQFWTIFKSTRPPSKS